MNSIDRERDTPTAPSVQTPDWYRESLRRVGIIELQPLPWWRRVLVRVGRWLVRFGWGH